MSLSDELLVEIKKYNNKSYRVREKTENYKLVEIVKYVIYCNKLIETYKTKVGMTNISFIQPDEQRYEVSYKQLEQISFIASLDPKNTIDSFKLIVFEFLNTNNMVDKVDLVFKFISEYDVYLAPIEYKSPVYLTIAYLCIKNVKPTTDVPATSLESDLVAYREVEDFGEEGSGYSEGFGSDADFDDEDFAQAFGDDDDEDF
tara:strand:- start:2753 stop:3358 length:606 start_codon:yes stop_codon:yes gene_type:complete